jgi:CubicO group peptidase (beta-lactamase class C family)
MEISSTATPDCRLESGDPVELGFSPDRLTSLRTNLDRFVSDGKQAGIVNLVARRGRIADLNCFGFRSLDPAQAMTRDTIFRIFSLSKMITTVAALTLLEEGRFSLLTPICEFLPKFRYLNVMVSGRADDPELVPAKRLITIQHLFTHTSGLAYEFEGDGGVYELYRRADPWQTSTLAEWADKVSELPLRNHPGEGYQYSVSIDVLGLIIQTVSGKPLGDFFRERILGPLGMKDTGFQLTPEQTTRLAQIYRHNEKGDLVPADSILGRDAAPAHHLPSGGAGLFSTIDDYVQFAQMLCQNGTYGGAQILGRKTVELMMMNHLPAFGIQHQPDKPAYGFGLGGEVRIDPTRSDRLGSVGEFGWYGAATTCCKIDRTEELIFLCFSQHFPFDEHELFYRFANWVYRALK